ncbi:hypothetical protein GW17_00011904 [Ensete ventricosum]|nr:hypothetical protein GW17_00011904 [Ensete ventricosum]
MWRREGRRSPPLPLCKWRPATSNPIPSSIHSIPLEEQQQQREMVKEGGGEGMRVLGKYELGRTLGEGNFGKVKYAKNVETGQGFAVKILDRSRVQSLNITDQIKREIGTSKLLKHPNVVRLYEILRGDAKIPKWLSPGARDILRRILDPNPITRINVAGIKAHEWFKQEYVPAIPGDDEEDPSLDNDRPFAMKQVALRFPDAAVLRWLDVSERRIRFTSNHSPKHLFEKIENIVTEMGFQVQKGHGKVSKIAVSLAESYAAVQEFKNPKELRIALGCRRGRFPSSCSWLAVIS